MYGSTVEHFKEESGNFDSINDIFKGTNSMMMIPNLGERRHFDTLYTLKKVQILISGSFDKLSFRHASIVENLKQKKHNLVSMNDISKNTNLTVTIPNLGERRHFETLYTLKKVQLLVLGRFEKLCLSHVSIVEHLKHKKDNVVSMYDISKNTNLMMTIPNLDERRHFDTLYTLKKVQLLVSESFEKLSLSHASKVNIKRKTLSQ